jgi:hypothetical protein
MFRRSYAAAESADDAYSRTLVRFGRGVADYFEGKWQSSVDALEATEQEFLEQHPGALWEINTAREVLTFAYWYLGATKRLVEATDAWVRDGQQRGDVFLANALGVSNMAPLVLDDVGRAKERVAAAMDMWSNRAYHVYHWLATLAHCNVAMYVGDSEFAWERLRREEAKMRSAFLLRSQSIVVAYLEARTRAALIAAAARKGDAQRACLVDARRTATDLRRTRVKYAAGHAELTDASVDHLAGRRREANDGLRRAIAEFERADLHLYAAIGRCRLGELIGGDEGRALRDNGGDFLRRGGVRRPERWLRLLSPAFDA